MTTFNKEDPLLNLTLDTDDLGIWLINEAPEGAQQMGHISWKEVARGVQQALLQEKFLIALAEIDKDYRDSPHHHRRTERREDMSQAPERIMAYGEINTKWGVQFKCQPMPMQGKPSFPLTEYVRADRIEELEDRVANMAGLWAKSDSEKQLLLGRIEELEAKLAKAVEALVQMVGKNNYADDPWEIASATLAELKGDKL